MKPSKYLDTNDPYFLIFFANSQNKRNKKKIIDEQVKDSRTYKEIEKDEMEDFIDKIKHQIFSDTGKICSNNVPSIKNSNTFNYVGNYIFWVNYNYWYRVGGNGKHTLEFANEFLDLSKLKTISVVTTKQDKKTNCLGRTRKHIYLFSKPRAKFNYKIANLKFDELKLGKRWIGHN